MTTAQLRTLRALVDQHNEGIRECGEPFLLTARGARSRLLDAWSKDGLTDFDRVVDRDDHMREVDGFGLTDKGIAMARQNGLRVMRRAGLGKVTHELKAHGPPFTAVLAGEKTFEIRKDDRGFEVGDILHLREWEPFEGRYTGRECKARVDYIARDAWGLPPGLVVMSIVVVGR